jgi:hypothetical protein
MRALLFLLLGFSSAAFGQKVLGSMDCKFTGTDFVYDCTVKLQKAGKPVEGVGITIGADMPSMPMAHNIKPVAAKPGTVPGEYHAKLDLDMAGEWAIKLRLSGAVRDQLVVLYHFDEKGSRLGKPPGARHKQ